jgi:hypothetical protein
MRLLLDYDREIEIKQINNEIRFTYYQFNKETFQQTMTEEEASTLALAIEDALGQKTPLKP